MTDHDYDESFLPARGLVQKEFPPKPICWRVLSEDEQVTHLHELDDWVQWLIGRYALDHRVIPPCWAEHGALVEELSALHTAWQTAYAENARGDAPLDWHAHFAIARKRLSDVVASTGCRPQAHR